MVRTKKLILALILSLALVGSQAISVFALDDLSTSSQEDNNQAVEEEKEQPKEEKAEEEAKPAPTEENKDESASDENTTTGESSDSKAENSEQTKPASDAKDEKDSETEKLTDGTYKPDEFTFTGGTGKLKITCDKVVIKGGDAFAELQLSSKNYTKLKVNGVTYASKVVDAKAVFNVP
ncbi:MAG: hypothetical protein Q4B78_03995, partial [Bacillota bacterium]|nr:hypothetical protein [Bacillota bacterium]